MEPGVTLFPFLSVLLSTMGVLAFLSISFLLITPELTEFQDRKQIEFQWVGACLLYTSPSPRDRTRSRMPSSA